MWLTSPISQKNVPYNSYILQSFSYLNFLPSFSENSPEKRIFLGQVVTKESSCFKTRLFIGNCPKNDASQNRQIETVRLRGVITFGIRARLSITAPTAIKIKWPNRCYVTMHACMPCQTRSSCRYSSKSECLKHMDDRVWVTKHQRCFLHDFWLYLHILFKSVSAQAFIGQVWSVKLIRPFSRFFSPQKRNFKCFKVAPKMR